MIRQTHYVLEWNDREPLERKLEENNYTFRYPETGENIPITHEMHGEEGRAVGVPGTPVGGGGTYLSVREDTQLEKILFELHEELKNNQF